MDTALDGKGRWRNVTVAFRVSSEESDDINMRVKLSGLTKQEYIVRRLSERDIIVQPNTRVYKTLRNQMTDILSELKRIEKCADVTNELLDTIQLIAVTLGGMKEE